MRFLACLLSLALLLCATARAVIDPSLQPADLYARHLRVLTAQVVTTDPTTATLTARITAIHKGPGAPGDTFTITAAEAMSAALTPSGRGKQIRPGDLLVAFAGKRLPRSRAADFLFFSPAGWGFGQMTTPEKWTWLSEEPTGVTGADKPAATIYGVWAGAVPPFAQLVADLATDRAWFPRRAYLRFKPDLALYQFSPDLRAVLIQDIDGDTRPDLYACDPTGGDKVFLQQPPAADGSLLFQDATASLGLASLHSSTAAFADVNADGRGDLLLDGRLYLATDRNPRFQPAPAQPTTTLAVQAASFIDLNHDGLPDILLAPAAGGLRALLHSATPTDPTFTEATTSLGLDDPTYAHTPGYFTSDDWDGDDRADLFFAAGPGHLLLRSSAGPFTRSPFDFKLDPQPQPAPGALFVPLNDSAHNDLLLTTADGWRHFVLRDGAPLEVTEYGGEISEGSSDHLATLSGDFDLDGRTDWFTGSRAANGQNRLILNRGYGKFMLASAHTHYDPQTSGEAMQLGAWGLAAGDLDGDGADDLVIASRDGMLTVLLNDTLAARAHLPEHPTADLATLAAVRLLTLRFDPATRGLLGATVRILDEQGHPLARRTLSPALAAGGQAPLHSLGFALREPARARQVEILYTDGHRQTTPLTLDQPHTTLSLRRP